MTESLPAPLVPVEVDLRGYEFMPYYGDRLRDSDMNSRATDAEYRAAHNLWWAAWKQLPAASLPDDETTLCRLADLGRDLKTWRAVRERALHGFVLCADGRFYHRVLAPLAVEAWEMRLMHRVRTVKARIAAMEKRLAKAATEDEKQHLRLLITQLRQSLSQTDENPVTDNLSTQSQSLPTSTTGQDRTGQDKRTAASPPSLRRERDLSTAHDGNGAAAAATPLIFPEKLSSADRAAAGDLLVDNPHAQDILDELQGVIASKKGCRDPMALLVTFIRQAQAGQFACSHAPRIQAEREGQAVTVEVERARAAGAV